MSKGVIAGVDSSGRDLQRRKSALVYGELVDRYSLAKAREPWRRTGERRSRAGKLRYGEAGLAQQGNAADVDDEYGQGEGRAAAIGAGPFLDGDLSQLCGGGPADVEVPGDV